MSGFPSALPWLVSQVSSTSASTFCFSDRVKEEGIDVASGPGDPWQEVRGRHSWVVTSLTCTQKEGIVSILIKKGRKLNLLLIICMSFFSTIVFKEIWRLLSTDSQHNMLCKTCYNNISNILPNCHPCWFLKNIFQVFSKEKSATLPEQ